MARRREDIGRIRFWRAVISEFVGSMFVVAIGCGSWTAGPATDSPGENEQLSQPQNYSSIVKVSLAFGLTYTGVLYCSRSVGDAHINPGVTVALLATRRVSFARGTLYVVAQLIGAVLGAAIAFLITAGGMPASPGPGFIPPGCTVLAPKVSESQGFGVEFLTSFFFVFVVFACYDNRKSSAASGATWTNTSNMAAVKGRKSDEREEAFVIGLIYSGLSLFAIPYTGGSINAARSFGPALVNNVWTSHWIYWFGPILGAVCGGAVYDVIFSTRSSFSRVRTCLLVFHHPRDADSQVRDVPVDDCDFDGTEQLHNHHYHYQQQQQHAVPHTRTGHNLFQNKAITDSTDSPNFMKTKFDHGFDEMSDIREDNGEGNNEDAEVDQRVIMSQKMPIRVPSQTMPGCVTLVTDSNIEWTFRRSGESVL